MIHTTINSWKNRKTINESSTEINEAYAFDFEDFIDTDLNGASQEIAIDSMIEEMINLVNLVIDKEAVGTGVDIKEIKKQARKEVADLWIEKIKSDLVNDRLYPY